MKRNLLFITLLFSSSSLLASEYVPSDTKDYFRSDNKTIHYRCSGGGKPLVIYSVAADNKEQISSQTLDAAGKKQPREFQPVYIKEGYKAIPFKASEDAMIAKSSKDYFIIQSLNPAYRKQYVEFGLEREDNKPFFVNTVNFAAIKYLDEKHQYVSTYKIFVDDKPYYQGFIPEQMQTFDQDAGVGVMKMLRKIHSYQYSWDQTTPWWDENNRRKNSAIHYLFAPQPFEDDPEKTHYNGFGFWICGADEDVATKKQLKSSQQIYKDKLKSK